MSGAAFLALVVLVALVGSFVLWLRFREPRSWDFPMREFKRTLSALSPDEPLPDAEKPRRRASSRGRNPG